MPIKKNLYFKPHLVDENITFKKILHTGKHTELKPQVEFSPENNELIFVKEGHLQLSCFTTTGEKRVLYNVGRNSLANSGAAVTGSNRYVRLMSKKGCSIVILDAYQIYDHNFIKDNPLLLMEMSKVLAKTGSLFSSRAYKQYFLNCTSRICQFICNHTTEKGDPLFQEMGTMTQNDIGLFSGSHPVTVSNILDNLRSEGVIGEVNPSYIEVLNYERLCELQNSMEDRG